MSIAHPVEARLCKSCDYRWFAQAGYSSLNPGPIMFNAGQNAALAHSRNKYDQHKFCQRCGSDKVSTVRNKRTFVPSAATSASATAPAPVAVVPPQPQQPPVAAPSQPLPDAAPTGVAEFQPSFSLPHSTVLVDRLRPPVRRPSLNMGDHVHDTTCAEGHCPLLAQQVPSQSLLRYVTFLGWLMIAVFVWFAQYFFLVPLAYLRAVAHSPAAKITAYILVLGGLGGFYSLYYLGVPAVPRTALRPWGMGPPAP